MAEAPVQPEPELIQEALMRVAKHGCRRANLLYQDRGMELVDLLVPAELFSSSETNSREQLKRDRAAQATHIVTEACRQLRDDRMSAALTVLGLDLSSYDQILTMRREIAARKLNSTSTDAFRKGQEEFLLYEVADEIADLLERLFSFQQELDLFTA